MIVGPSAKQTWHCCCLIVLLSAIEDLKNVRLNARVSKTIVVQDTGAPATYDCRLMSSRLQAGRLHPSAGVMSRLLVAIMVAAASAFSEFGSGGQSDCPREFEIPAGTIVGPNDGRNRFGIRCNSCCYRIAP